MPYVPPHKRPSKENDKSSKGLPKPELPPPLFNKNLKLKSPGGTSAQYQNTGYEYEDIFRWFAVGLDDHNLLPPSVHLQPISEENLDGKFVKRLALYHGSDLTEESSSTVVTESFIRRPWEYIADTVLPDLVSSFEDLRREIESQKLVGIKPIIITRFGKVLFSGRPSLLSEDKLRPLRRSFNTNIPDSFVNYITKEGVSKNGLEFAKDKEAYHVFLSDFNQSGEDIFCDCRVLKEDAKLQIYKIKRSYVRHMLRDISCLEKDLDMRLDLCTRRPVTALTDDELQSIKELIDSAILDREVKGGLRWPLGKAVSGDKIRVTAVWHVISNKYKNPSLKLKIKNVDRYKFLSSTGEPTREVVIMLKGVASELMKQKVDMNLTSEMLKDDLKALWNNFLCCERFP
ncbi:uncharacterized protein LOC133790611 [Humulus lupulus]|uniref:uncharacterized protein LOC133790611 n=1 Tax=Humulus lupulus TaxID=3486 RepID=UPI002B415FB5|nr:uncharacterized protein LOC133790611 [Humulus lupulus]XP_062084282.1 uncharacterized protein LOC133790611 [Humulus lupulus]